MAHLQPNSPFGNGDSISTWENMKKGTGSKVGNLWVRGAQDAPPRRGWCFVKLWTLEIMQIQINYSLFFRMQRRRCHHKRLPRKRCKINKNSSHRFRVTLPDARWCGHTKDPDNHGARSIPANRLNILSVISSLDDLKAPDAGFWEDGPTLTFLSYWAFSPDSKHLLYSLCPCEAHACWAALPHLPLETSPEPPGPCMVHLPCDRHPHSAQAVDSRSPSPFQ